MGYMHIDNLYKNQDILLFKECYALEKIHGTSAHVAYDPEKGIRFFSGGAKNETFVALFNEEELKVKFEELLEFGTTFYGEAYGGKMQGMSKSYGKELKFIVFDVKIGHSWLSVPQAAELARSCGFEFVFYQRVSTDLEALDEARDMGSIQAVRNGLEEGHIQEGVVLRPLIEVTKNNGARVICKHKRPEFAERKTIPDVDPAKREIMEKAGAIAEEWVTPMRLTHVLDKLGNPDQMENIPQVIKAMVEDVCREASDEIVDSKAARKAIGAKAVQLYKARVQKVVA